MAKTSGRVIDLEVGGRCCLVLVAVQAMNRRLVGVGNDHRHRGAG